ncbi:MAG: FAD-binding oxidoreductase [Phycisphaerales bacterium]|nr:FAD-binding oxidoreductase [Phycisphaerales bacterium]
MTKVNTSSDSSSTSAIHLPLFATLAQLRVNAANDLRNMNVGEVRFEKHDRMLYATDASMYQVEPIGVVILNRPESAVEIVRYCGARNIPMLPRGSGTSLAGQCVNQAVMMDMSARCRGIRSINVAAGTVTVEPGVTLDQLNAALSPHGMMFGPDVATSSHATLGGMIGNNSAGARSILYGRTVENVIAMRVVTAQGAVLQLFQGSCDSDPAQNAIARRLAALVLPLADEIRKRIPKIMRHVDGYNVDIVLQQLQASTAGTFDRVNLAQLLCGSEGTLAVMMEATLKIVPKPERTGLAIIGFSNIEDALTPLILMINTKPSAVELIDDVVLEAARDNTEYRHYVDLMPKPFSGKLGAVMYVEYQGANEAQLNAKFDSLAAVVPGVAMRRYLTTSSIASAWKLRKAGEPLLHNIPGDRKPMTFVEDTAVDPSQLLRFVNDFKAIVTRHGTTAAYYAHASVGCLHIRPLVKITDEASRENVTAIAVEVADLVAKYGGALSGEHGDGRLRTPLLERVLGKELCELFRQVKNIFDPHGLMNPGNLISTGDPSLIMKALRVKPHDQDIAIAKTNTFFRFEKEHGFEHAVESCNGAGLCRKTQPTGVMCPSYRATLDERHSTRGRGNALRLALSGQMNATDEISAPGQAWSDAETKATLDLCLSCKACQSECPSNVDISKMKAEFQAQEFAELGKIPLRTRLIGRIRGANRLGSRMWPIANALLEYTPLASFIRSVMGFHAARTVPSFGPATHRWLARRNQTDNSSVNSAPHSTNPAHHVNPQARPTVLLFADCFTNFNETHIARHAVELLEAFGYRVVMSDAGCCGRTLISVGMLAEASLTCAQTAKNLLSTLQQENAVALLALEPSCLSAIKDDWLDLQMSVDVKQLNKLAARSMLVEEFLDARWNEHPLRPEISPGNKSVIFHGHCHQKALWGSESGVRLLRRIFGDRLTALDSGCCGMAGSFGYAAHRYDLSMAIGEQSLFPAIRKAPDAVVVAPGTSCRHQIRDGTDAMPLHPVELIAKLFSQHAPAHKRHL